MHPSDLEKMYFAKKKETAGASCISLLFSRSSCQHQHQPLSVTFSLVFTLCVWAYRQQLIVVSPSHSDVDYRHLQRHPPTSHKTGTLCNNLTYSLLAEFNGLNP